MAISSKYPNQNLSAVKNGDRDREELLIPFKRSSALEDFVDGGCLLGPIHGCTILSLTSNQVCSKM